MLFSDDPAQITSLKNIRVSITLKPLSARQGYLYSLKARHNLSVKTQFLRFVLSKFHHLYCRAVLRSYSVSIYRFKRDNFLSENVAFESKTCVQNGQYFERRLDIMKTQKIVEDNENNRAQNIPFECSTRYLTSERSERVRYRAEHEKIKFVSTSGHIIFCLLCRHR